MVARQHRMSRKRMLLNRGCGCLSKYTSPVLANHAFKSCSGCLEAPGLERKANASKGLRLLSPLVRSRYDLHKMRHVGLDDDKHYISPPDKHYISPPMTNTTSHPPRSDSFSLSPNLRHTATVTACFGIMSEVRNGVA